MTKTLVLLRHAKSSWESPAARDFDRPLASRGERDAPRIGKALRASGVEVERLVVSPATRARQTAELVAAAAKLEVPVVFEVRIYEAGVETLIAVARGIPDDVGTAMLVGHNPGFESLLAELCGPSGAAFRVRMPTAALACVALDVEAWRDVGAGRGSLEWMLVPRLLA